MELETSHLGRRWTQAEVYRKLTTTKHISKVVIICSVIPGMDETTMVDCLKKRSDLDTLLELYCEHQDNLTVETKAQSLWRALQITLDSGESPRDLNWQPPSKGSPSEIATEFHAAVARAIFRVPFLDFVKYALGYSKAHFVGNLFNAVCHVRDGLCTMFQDCFVIKELYIVVEKALTQQHHPLARWIINSSLGHPKYTLHDAFKSYLEPIQRLFANRNFDLVLKRLIALDKRFSYVGQRYNWTKWSTDLNFWECVDQALWSGKCPTPFMSPYSPTLDWDERLRFLEGLHAVSKPRERSIWGRAIFSLNKLKETQQSDCDDRGSRYSIRQGLEIVGVVSLAVGGLAIG